MHTKKIMNFLENLPSLALRGFRDYSVRTKLLVPLLVVALIPLSISSFISLRDLRRFLTDSANTALNGGAASVAQDVDSFLTRSLADVRTAAGYHIWEEYLALSSAERPGSETVLYSDLRALAGRDQTYIGSVELLDRNGTIIADTDSTDREDIGNSRSQFLFFTEAIKNNSPYVSPVEFDEGSPSISFSAPVHDRSGKIIGVLRIRYSAAVLQSILVEAADNAGVQGGTANLFDENHIALAVSDAPDHILKTVTLLPTEKLAQLQAERRLPQGTAESLSLDNPDLEMGLNNANQQPIFVIESEGKQAAAAPLRNLPWVIVFAQPQATYLAPLAEEVGDTTGTVLIIAALMVATAVVLAQAISRPIGRLTAVAQRIAGGDFSMQVPVTSSDEIGTLAGALNSMRVQLHDLIGTLEQRAASRTRAIETSAEMGRRLSAFLNQSELVRAVVEQLQKELGYYHVHIYLLDKNRENLQMVAGSGDIGQKMLEAGHSLPVGKGLVGRSARLNTTVLISDVSQAADWLPNPLLPETRSEVAVPIALRDEVLGVLDVQQNTVNGLSQADADLIASVASQVAVALQNARLFVQVQRYAERQARLDAIGQQIQSARSVEEALKITVRELGRTLGAKNTRVSLASPESAVRPNPT